MHDKIWQANTNTIQNNTILYKTRQGKTNRFIQVNVNQDKKIHDNTRETNTIYANLRQYTTRQEQHNIKQDNIRQI